MKIKRYSAASMRAALALVRAEQGPDAVILSSRRGADGIEVIAAVDYDEALFVEANRQRTLAASPEASAPAPSASPELIAAPSRAPAPAGAARPPVPKPSPKLIPASFRKLTLSSLPAIAPQLFAPPQPPRPTPGLGAMQRELQDLRQMLETGLAGMTWNDKRMREPLNAQALEQLP